MARGEEKFDSNPFVKLGELLRRNCETFIRRDEKSHLENKTWNESIILYDPCKYLCNHNYIFLIILRKSLLL